MLTVHNAHRGSDNTSEEQNNNCVKRRRTGPVCLSPRMHPPLRGVPCSQAPSMSVPRQAHPKTRLLARVLSFGLWMMIVTNNDYAHRVRSGPVCCLAVAWPLKHCCCLCHVAGEQGERPGGRPSRIAGRPSPSLLLRSHHCRILRPSVLCVLHDAVLSPAHPSD